MNHLLKWREKSLIVIGCTKNEKKLIRLEIERGDKYAWNSRGMKGWGNEGSVEHKTDPNSRGPTCLPSCNTRATTNHVGPPFPDKFRVCHPVPSRTDIFLITIIWTPSQIFILYCLCTILFHHPPLPFFYRVPPTLHYSWFINKVETGNRSFHFISFNYLDKLSSFSW